MGRLSVMCFAVSMMAASVPAAAQTYFPGTANDMLAVARAFGTIERGNDDSEGRPVLLGDVDGVYYSVVLYGCENNINCESVQFYASFISDNNTLPFVNAWNQEKRYATAYLDQDGDAVLAMSANIDFGVSRQQMIDTFDIWVTLMAQFNDRIYNTGAEAAPAASAAPRK